MTSQTPEEREIEEIIQDVSRRIKVDPLWDSWLRQSIHQELQKVIKAERWRIWLEANKLPMQEGRADLVSLLDLQSIINQFELDQPINSIFKE